MREQGYYWVLFKGDWYVSRWDSHMWPLNGMLLLDRHFVEIDEKRIVRGDL